MKTTESKKFNPLILGALGIVYGDIGTSPLYALRECFHGAHSVEPNQDNIFGILSLFFWSLVLVIVFKYIANITRVDNHGEGGILSLLALCIGRNGNKILAKFIIPIGLFGAALLYSDGALTPAISVLSAVEGLSVITNEFDPFVVPISVVILLGLFLIQRHGTGKVGTLFGPIMLIWFSCLAASGVWWILKRPEILTAISPTHALQFYVNNGMHGFFILGSVVLCITGGEALYADMGHFGRKPISLAWYTIVFPALLLNYFGQGALLLEQPELASKAFYSLVSVNLLLPFVVLATMATIIASQALISGSFSLTRQAVQLGYLPRLSILHTSRHTEGQIYVPEVNFLLMCACIFLVVEFHSSANLAAAYGLAVTGTMTITTLLFFYVIYKRWTLSRAVLICLIFLSVDLAFLSANAVKFFQGAWIPLVIGIGLFTVMTTWKAGRGLLAEYLRQKSAPLDEFLDLLNKRQIHRVPGTSVFMSSNVNVTPPILLHHVRHNQILHEKVILLSIQTSNIPFILQGEQVTIEELKNGFFRVTARYGFMQTPDILDILNNCRALGLETDRENTSYFLGREKLVITKSPVLPVWRKNLFAFLSKNSRTATDFFHIPPEQVVELGMHVEL